MFFNGQHRQTPNVSLGGISKLESRDALLERTKEERRRRNEQRRKVEAAARLQRSWKSYNRRKNVARQLLEDFNSNLVSMTSSSSRQATVTADALGRLIAQLGVFYQDSPNTDQQLVQLCSLLCKHRSVLQHAIAAKPAQWRLRLQVILSLALRFLGQHAQSSDVPVSMPLRLLEVLLQPSFYSPAAQESLLEPVVLHICRQNGYFATILNMLLKRIPAPVELSSKAPSPFADGLRNVLCLPLLAVKTQRDAAVTQLCKDLLPLSGFALVRLYLLPSLMQRLSLPELLRCTHSLVAGPRSQTATSTDAQSSPIIRVSLSVFPPRQPLCFPIPDNHRGWSLYSLLVALEYCYSPADVEAVEQRDVAVMLDTIASLLPSVAPPAPPNILEGQPIGGHIGGGGSQEEEDNTWSSPDAMLAGRIPPYLVPHFLQGQCQYLLTGSTKLVHVILATVTSDTCSRDCFRGMAAVCSHYLLFQPGVFRKSVLFSQICFRSSVLRQLWKYIYNYSLMAPSGGLTPLLDLIGYSVYEPPASLAQSFVEQLSTFSALLSSHLASVDASSFRAGAMAFSVGELMTISSKFLDASLALLRSNTLGVTKVIVESMALNLSVVSQFGSGSLASRETGGRAESLAVSPYGWSMLFKLLCSFLHNLHARDARLGVFPLGHWFPQSSQFDVHRLELLDPSQVFTEVGEGFNPSTSTVTLAQDVIIMRTLPFITAFLDRAKLFIRLTNQERMLHGRGPGFWNDSALSVTVRRSHVYEDSFAELSALPVSDMKKEMSVHLVNFQGLDEAGIDGGGILREFLAVFVKTAFDSSMGFFKYTDDQRLYPNPEVEMIHKDPLIHYSFLGKMLGKVIYENLLVDLPLASFFMQKVLDGSKAQLSFDHLESLDPEMYRNLLFLRTYDGEVASLSLNFTTVNNGVGQGEVVELQAGGSNIVVTNDNCEEYIAAVADYKLNTQIESQCAAFREGLASVVNLAWLRLFTPSEVQVLISGAQVPVDLEDLREHTHYSGGYSEDHGVIKLFWEVAFQFNADQRQQLLKFVTSCSRPPLLGFQDFHPKFAVHNAVSIERLPTASTCMNLLKLPPYQSVETMRERLLYAISSNSGFELS